MQNIPSEAHLLPNLVLIGFSGSGKSSVGRIMAERLGWRYIDVDAEIAQAAGKSVPAIFAEEGEAAFRALETAHLAAALAGEHAVVATGGGAVLREENRARMLERGFVVCLEARPETIFERLRRHQAEDEEGGLRPLLAADDPLARIRALKTQRQALYAHCHATVHTDGRQAAEVAAEAHRHLAGAGLAYSPVDGEGPLSVATATGYYHVHVGAGLHQRAGALVAARHPGRRAFLVSDANVYRLAGEAVRDSLASAGLKVSHHVVPAGEASKTLAHADELYRWLIAEGAERRDVLLALGGGVVGDLTGFVAATYLRGVAYVQLPTTLLAMVDSSVGGKTAVDHELGKNLIGAFHPPSLVVADIASLGTLPRRERRSGWAEVIKHAMIADAAMFEHLEANAGAITRLEPGLLAPVVRRNIWLKARVVAADERESGQRMILNYGHTLGHAVESVTNFALAHGEAVAIGMAFAAELAVRLGRLDRSAAERQNALLRAFDLATSPPPESGLNPDAVLRAMSRDKKVEAGVVRWVLPTRIGQVEVVHDVPAALVRETMEEVLR